jgi:hypothetical protein
VPVILPENLISIMLTWFLLLLDRWGQYTYTQSFFWIIKSLALWDSWTFGFPKMKKGGKKLEQLFLHQIGTIVLLSVKIQSSNPSSHTHIMDMLAIQPPFMHD